jgi:hypothetical protein
MTAELRVSVPDDVAEWLTQQPDVSDTVTEAVRAAIRAAQIDEILRAAGVEVAEPSELRGRPESRPRDVLAEGRRMLADRGTAGQS